SAAKLSKRWLNSTRDSGVPIDPTRISGFGNPISFSMASHFVPSLNSSAFLPKGTSNENLAMIMIASYFHPEGLTFVETTFRACAAAMEQRLPQQVKCPQRLCILV